MLPGSGIPSSSTPPEYAEIQPGVGNVSAGGVVGPALAPAPDLAQALAQALALSPSPKP